MSSWYQKEENTQNSNINPYRVPVAGESYEYNNTFFYCVYDTECEWKENRVVTTGVRVREVRTGEIATIPIEKFEAWCSGKKRTDV